VSQNKNLQLPRPRRQHERAFAAEVRRSTDHEASRLFAPTPSRALREAGTFVALLTVLVGVGCFLVMAGIVDAVAPPVPAYDDEPWLALNPPEVPDGAFEDLTGLAPQQVVSRLGPPMRVRRDSDLPDGCVQSYIYATRVLGERTTTGVCFNSQGRAASFLGQTVSFDLPFMSDDPRGTFAAAGLMSLILAIPLSVILAIRRRLPQGLASLRPKDGGV